MRQFRRWEDVVAWAMINRDALPDDVEVAVPIYHPLVVDRWIKIYRSRHEVLCSGDAKAVGDPLMKWDSRGYLIVRGAAK